jgi:hypothetical protein
MYRVGFGDCFLVSFPGSRHVLIDCGVHALGDIKTLDDVLADIATTTKRRLAVIVMSHAHEDHIAGFARGEELFRTFEIGEIWLPWTENPNDQHARELRQHQAALFDALAEHFGARPPSAEVGAVLANAAVRRNTVALDNLRAGFGTDAHVSWFAKDDELDEVGGIPGLAVRFLGPPRDEAFLKKMDPPKPERYLRVGANGSPEWVNGLSPFDKDKWAEPGDDDGLLSTRQRNALRNAAELSPDALAFALDRALNNTSLVCLFSFRGQSMLFPGDAQYGNWKAWLEAEDAPDILGGLGFYKVAHHGSENATPKTALEGMRTGRFAAMLSTQSIPWPSIPYPKLMTALERQTNQRVIRSDSLPVPNAPEGPVVPRLPKGFRKGRLWVDYFLTF